MIKILKKAGAVLVCASVMMFGNMTNVSAQEEWSQSVTADGVLTLKGSGVENGMTVNLYVSGTDGTKKVIRQQKADADNVCTFSVELEKTLEASGIYTVKAVAMNGSKHTQEFTYCMLSDIERLVLGDSEKGVMGLKEAKQQGVTQTAEVLKNNGTVLTYFNPAVKDMVERGLFAETAKLLEKEEITVDNARETITRVAVAAIFPHRTDKAELLKEYSDEIRTENIKEYSDLFDKNGDTNKFFDKTVSRLNAVKNTYGEISEMYKDIYHMSVLAKLDYSYGTSGVENILTSHTDVFDLTVYNSSGNDKTAVLKKIGKTFEDKKILTVSDVQDILDVKIKKTDNGSGRSSGGSGGSGGGSGSGSGGLISGITPPAANGGQSPVYNEIAFGDMKGYEWAEDSVEGLLKLGVLNGYSNTEFKPFNKISRAEFCKIICKLFGFTASSGKTNFADVSENSWYSGYVNALYGRGLIKGTDANHFNPDNYISRQEAAVIVFRTLGVSETTPEDGEELFADSGKIAEYARGAVNTLKALEIMNGNDKNEFCPDAGILRAETAVMAWNVYNYTEEDAKSE